MEVFIILCMPKWHVWVSVCVLRLAAFHAINGREGMCNEP